MTIEQIENKFKEISNLHDIDLTKSVIRKSDYPIQQVKTRKDKSKEYGEVFTPLFLVDIMLLMKFKELTPKSLTCDLCSGYGQFTVRLMRMMYNKFHINPEEWLKESHTLTELQLSSCAKLVYIFGPYINLYAGDSLKLKDSEDSDSGILFYNEDTHKWYNNKLVDKLVRISAVNNNIKLLTFIFENNDKTDKLQILFNRLNIEK